MKGVSYITDAENRRKAVVIDIDTIAKHPEEVEDLLDTIVAASRRNEPKRDWEDVKKELLNIAK
jgi:hypothetical protein